jgi:hypothetical protein
MIGGWLGPPPGPQRPLAALLAASALLAACGSSSGGPDDPNAGSARAPRGLVATLEDDVRELPRARIAWSTYWKLCWKHHPAATAYELQAITGEGASPSLRHQAERCLRLQTAAGNNPKSQGLLYRDLLLQLKAGQLGYRVRAALGEGRVSEWSRPVAVGQTTAR